MIDSARATWANLDFALVIVILTAISGGIWAIDALLFRSARVARVARGEQVKEPTVVDYARSFFPILLIVLVIRSFLFEPFRIPSESMMPTLLTGDFIFVNKFAYGLRLPVINTKIVNIGDDHVGVVLKELGSANPREFGPFLVSFFDVPMVDNIKLDKTNRVAVLLMKLEKEKNSAQIRLVSFLPDLAIDRFDIKEMTREFSNRRFGN